MEIAAGTMGSLVPKLLKQLGEEYNLSKGTRREVQILTRELESIVASLRMMAGISPDQLDETSRLWAQRVRDISYDMEDILDTFLLRADDREPADDSNNMLNGGLKKMKKQFIKAKARREISVAITEISTKIQKLTLTRAAYKIDDIMAKPAATTSTDPRILNLYRRATELVGIHEPRDELIKMLSIGEDDTSSKKMKIISIVGFGGLGKTTLAKAAYDKVKPHFGCSAFIAVGRNPDRRKVLRDILVTLNVDGKRAADMLALDERQLIEEARTFLQGKRYLIVLDDLWDTTTWEYIAFVFIESNNGSRIIVTTRKAEVATCFDEVYKMKPLSYDDSEMLLHTRIFGGDEHFSDYDGLSKASVEILKKCGGVPLAIITVASLLSSRPIEDWSNVYNSIGSVYDKNIEFNNMIKILSLSYYDLPSHLRTCLLYLSMYPEDHVINKTKLIWSWIAEGLVHVQPGIGLFKIGESYLHELLNRSMIQPVPIEGTDHVYGCRVHDMVLHFIRSLSREENFVSVLDEEGQISTSGTLRRLAIQNRKEEHILGNHTDLALLRTLNVIGCPIYVVPPASSFKLLRVLDLENCGSMEGYDHEHLGELLLLRYLGLRNTLIRKLPATIGRLKFLQTLELEGSGIEELPASMGQLGGLMCLSADWTTRVDEWIGKLTSLQQLEMYPGGGDDDQDSVRWFVDGLKNLSELRVLRFLIKALDEGKLRDLLKSISILHAIEVLHFDCYGALLDRGVQLEPAGFPQPLHNLRFLELRWLKFSKLPAWISPQDLPNLYHLWLMVSDVDEKDLEIIGGFPSLRELHLLTESTERGDAITCGSGAFQILKFCSISKPFKFEHGAMSKLEVLDFHLNIRRLSDSNNKFDLDFGLGNLNSLKQVIVQIHCLTAYPEDVGKAESSLRDAIRIHPNHPTLKISLFGQQMKTVKSDPENMTPKLEKVADDGPDKISNSAKGKEVEASTSMSNENRELERISSMDLVTEAMGSVATKLDKLLQEEYSLGEGIRKQVKYLERELERMHTALTNVTDLPLDQIDARVIIWSRDVKEVSHDMECIIDTFLMPLVERPEPADPDRFKYVLEKMGGLLETGKAFYSKSSVHDGIDDTSDELIRMLSMVNHNDAYNKKMKILSIVRSEGLGKNTLAQKVFDTLSPQFDCGAFVLVGQNPDLRKVFTEILIGLDKQKYKSFPMTILDLTELICLVRKSLINKRFFVVVDDIWDLNAWDIIKCALMENDNGSAVLITTRRQNWKTYDDDDKLYLDPKKWFYKKLFGSEDKCRPELKAICEQLIATSDGIISVLIETVELLRSVPWTLKDWQAVCDRTKLALSYPDLPDYLKMCLLYFSMFRKGHEITGERLVWAWIAEGFIQETQGQTLQEVGESYLCDLVNRKIIEAVKVDASGKVLSCRVYDLVHDFIILKSTEENFVAILNDSQDRSLTDKVHRLSIQGNTEVNFLPKVWLSQVKSLVVTCDTMPSVSGFPALCVMDLGGCHSLQAGHLKGINNATSLKYLVLGGKCIAGIPKEITKLTDLETLDLSASGLRELPKSIFSLRKLVRLRVSSHMNIPDGIAKMSALQELGDVNIIKPELLKTLCKLVNLRVLRIAIWSWDESFKNSVKQICDNLCSLVRYRGNIQSLSIMTCSSLDFMESLDDNWAPRSLQMLEIRHSAFYALPSWFHSLSNISSLTIEVYELSMAIIVILGNLPSLGSLFLTSIQLPKGYFVIDSERFKNLASLKFVSNAMVEMFGLSPLSPPNDTQQLKRLTTVFQASRTEVVNKDFSFGLENLCSLEHIRVEIICSNASQQMVNNAEAAIREAISTGRSNHSNLEIRRLEEENMVVEEDLCNTQQEHKETKKWQKNNSSTKKIRVTGKIFRQKRRKQLLEHIQPFLDPTSSPHFAPSQSP